MNKLIALATLLAACATDSIQPPLNESSPSAAFTLDDSAFSPDGPRWMTDTSGPMLSGELHVAHATPRAFVDGKPVGSPAIVRDGIWQIQLPEGTIGHDTRVVLQVELAPGEPDII